MNYQKKKSCDDVIGKSNSDEETFESESNNKVDNEKNIPGNNPSGKNTITEESTLKHSLDKLAYKIYLKRFISCLQ